MTVQQSHGIVIVGHDVADGIPLYRQMKALETPGPNYLYWIEKTLKFYME